jgi:PEP-CTERM motif
MKTGRTAALLVALLAFLHVTTGVAAAAILTYQYSGTFDTGPLAGTAYSGTFSYDTAGDPNKQTGIPLTFSVPFTPFNSTTIEAHPTGIPLFTLVDGRLTLGNSLHISITHFVSPELNQPLPPIQFASVFFSPDPNFSVVSQDNDTSVSLAVPEPGTSFLLTTGLAALLGVNWRRRQRQRH